MHDVNGKALNPGSEVYIPCKILSMTQVDNQYRLELELKYHNRPYHRILTIIDVAADQVVKAE